MRAVIDGRIRLLGADAPAVLTATNDLASLLHDLALKDGKVRSCSSAAT